MVHFGNPISMLGIALTLGVCFVAGYSVQKEYIIAPEWAGKQADIYFVVDSSSSIWINDYVRMLTFVSDLVKGMDIGPNKTRVGMSMFSFKFKEYLSVENTRTKNDLVNAILDTPYVPENGYISRAINGMRIHGLSKSKARTGVPQIAVFFTDGESRYKQLTIDNTTLAKNEGIFMYTIGIGRVNKLELRNMASDPKEDFSFFIHDFYSFNSIKAPLMKSMADVHFLQGDEGTCGKKDMADVLFVYDEYAMGVKNSLKVKDFIKSLLPELSINSGNIRIGVISKSSHKGDINLGQYLTREDFTEGIDQQRGPTITYLLKKARLDGFKQSVGARSHAKKRIVLFLHGKVHDIGRLVNEARRAKYRSISIFIVDINTSMPKGTLEKMTNEEKYITHLTSFEGLIDKGPDFINTFCRELK